MAPRGKRGPYRKESLIERFWKYVSPEPTSGCWLWTGSTQRFGYGVIHLGGSPTRLSPAHRVSYSHYVGAIPDGLFVLHKCDNPACVNPDHLFIGDQKANIQDMQRKRRHVPRHVLNSEQVADIRSKRLKGNEFAALYGVARKTIFNVQSGRHY